MKNDWWVSFIKRLAIFLSGIWTLLLLFIIFIAQEGGIGAIAKVIIAYVIGLGIIWGLAWVLGWKPDGI